MADNQSNTWAVGIDLGNANTRVAVLRNDEFEIIPDEEGSRSMPSCVSFSDRQRLIGSPAKRQLTFNSENTVFDVMFLVGRDLHESDVQTYAKRLPFKVIDEYGQLLIRVNYLGEEKSFNPRDILAMILSKAKQNAEVYLGSVVRNIVLGVPAFFETRQRRAVQDAARIAGLNVIYMPAAPFGASWGLAVQWRPEGEHHCVMLDLGAVVFNVTVFVLEEGIVETKSVAGDLRLGGEDFITRILIMFNGEIKRKWKVDVTTNKRSLQRLRNACERAMCELSSTRSAEIHIDALYNGRDFQSSITRARFEELCQDLFRATLVPIDRALTDAKVDKSKVGHIFPIGGCSRIPRIQKLWTDYFNGKELNKSLSAEEAQVYGLAVGASIHSLDTSSPRTNEVLLLPVLSMSIGIETLGGMFAKVVERNTMIPCTKSEIFSLRNIPSYYSSDGIPKKAYLRLPPASRALCVYEGERQRVRDNKLLGFVPLNLLVPTPGPEEAILEVTAAIDNEQNLKLRVVEKGSGSKLEMFLPRSEEMSESVVQRLKSDEEGYRKANEAEAQRHLERSNLDSQISSVYELLRNSPHVAQINDLHKSVEEIRRWADKNEFAPAADYSSRIRELDRIESHLQDREARVVAQEALKDDLRQADQTLAALTQTPKSQSLLREIRDMASWLSRASPGELSEYDAKRKRLEAIIAESTVDGSDVKDPSEDSRYNENTGKSTSDTRRAGSSSAVDGADQPLSSQAEPASSTATSKSLGNESSTEMRADESFDMLFIAPSGEERGAYTDATFERISTYLKNDGQTEWAKNPRLYTVLRLMGRLDVFGTFLQQGQSDIWFPFSSDALPSSLGADTQLFLDIQPAVFSKALQLEKDPLRKHAHFSQEPSTFKVIGRLGRGAHGTVDKVMSIISQQEYARKRFKRAKGLRKENINTFMTELKVLKRVRHRHCVDLIGSYSDPKYFTLIMRPVGDCDLAKYYTKAAGNPDALSLLRGFFGCLANAVQYLHGQRIRHRDIKPQNIIVRGDQVLLTDFGIAHNWENLTRGTTTADSAKTLVYAAPEVVRVEPRNTAADIWSLGCVALEMATLLKGHTVRDMWDFFKEIADIDDHSYHANRDGIEAWVGRMQNKALPADNVVLDWSVKMLQVAPQARPTATLLVEDAVAESRRGENLFCGPCCLEDTGSSTEDEEEDDGEAWEQDDDKIGLV